MNKIKCPTCQQDIEIKNRFEPSERVDCWTCEYYDLDPQDWPCCACSMVLDAIRKVDSR